MSEVINDCAFCDTEALAWRTIRGEDLYFSIVSKPWFRSGQCLVIPRRHIETPTELNTDEGAGIMQELGRLSARLDKGFGTGIMQKYQPLQPEDGGKVSHTHFHVFPRQKQETSLFPVPDPNNFDGFYQPTDEEVKALVEDLR